MSWHFLERWIEKSNQHSTLIGKLWITFLIVCRMVIVASVGDRVYTDEQSEFKCNSLQPGCSNICFNKFSPISHLRFWSFQIMFVSAPSVVFVIYSGHKSKLKRADNRKRHASHEENEDETSEKQTLRTKPTVSPEPRLRSTSKNFKVHQDPLSTCLRNGFNEYQCQYSAERRRGGLTNDDFSNIKSTVIHLPRDFLDENICNIKMEDPLIDQRYNHTEKFFKYSLGEKILLLEKAQKRATNIPYEVVDCEEIEQKMVGKHITDNTNKNNNKTDNARKLEPGRIGRHNLIMDQSADELQQGFSNYNRANFMNEFPTELFRDVLISEGYENLSNADICQPHDHFEKNALTQRSESLGVTSGANSRNENIRDKYKSAESEASKVSKKQTIKTKSSSTANKVQPFSVHFRWYIFTVFLRLLMELAFTVMQIALYGFSVPELYKCKRWPCPNTVDCFISRPNEKTIFLWFMLLYSCICVVLNVCEFMYLIYAYVKKQKNKLFSRKFPNPPKSLFLQDQAMFRKFNDGFNPYENATSEYRNQHNKSYKKSATSSVGKSSVDLLGSSVSSKYDRHHDTVNRSCVNQQFDDNKGSSCGDSMAFVYDSEIERGEFDLDYDVTDTHDMQNEMGFVDVDIGDTCNADPNADF